MHLAKIYIENYMMHLWAAAAIWGQQELSCISAIQNRACRYFMGVSKYTPNAAVQEGHGLENSRSQTKFVCAKTVAKAHKYG